MCAIGGGLTWGSCILKFLYSIMEDDVLTKASMIDYLNENIGLSKRECQIFFEVFLEIITKELVEKKDVKLVNFGNFKVMKKNARIGRNPRTKEEVMISERSVIKFKPSNFLINFINSNISNINEET